MMAWISVELGKLLDGISVFQLKRVWVITNCNTMSHGLTKDVYNIRTKETSHIAKESEPNKWG
jgi:hypothetical protein